MENKAQIIKLIDRCIHQAQWAQASELCQELLAGDPDCVAGFSKLGRALTKLGKVDQAIQVYSQWVQLQPHQGDAYAELGYLYQHKQEYPNAIAHYQKALSLKPYWMSVAFNLAVVYQHLGDWDQSIEHYQQVISQKKDHGKALFNLAVLYEKKGRWEKAKSLYNSVIQLQPDHLNAVRNYGGLLFRHNRFKEATDVLKRALAHHPESAQLWSSLGQSFLAQEKREDAIQAHQQALVYDPTLISSQMTLGRLWLHYQQYSKAIACFDVVCHHNPHSGDAHHDLGIAYAALGDWEKALACFGVVISTQSEFLDVFCQRLQDCTPQDWYEQAQVECKNFLQSLQCSDDLEISLGHLFGSYQYLGRTLLNYGALSQAEGYLHKALQLRPDCIELYGQLGDCFVRQKRFDAAVSMFNLGLAMHPGDPDLLARLGHVLKQRGDFSQAASCYEQLIQQFPHYDFEPSSEGNLLETPQKFYASTRDWVTDRLNTLPSAKLKFVEVDWGQQVQSSAQEHEAHSEAPQTCGGVTCTSCMSRLIDGFAPIPLGEDLFQCTLTQKASFTPPPTFVATIPEGQAWIAPQQNAWLICKEIAILTDDSCLLGDVSRFYPWYLPGCSRHDISQHSAFECQDIPPLQEINGKVAILSGLSGHVYYHWMIDVLPRIGLLQAAGENWETIDWFVVNSFTKPFQKETLRTLGVPFEKIFESDRLSHFRASQLVVPSFPGHLDWVPKGTIDFLRRNFLKQTPSSRYQRIYISRSAAKYRQVVNEKAVINILEQYGFVSLNLENFSVSEQAEIFAGAEIIVAPHGAALTNLVFCSEGTTVIEFFSPDYIRTDYWMISQQLGLEHYYIKGKGFKGNFILKLMHQNSLTEDMWIDPNSLYLAMNKIGLKRC